MQTPSHLPALVPSQEFYRDSLSYLLETRSFLAAHGYLRINNCFDAALAESAHAELKEDGRYTRMEKETATDYGVLRYEGRPSPCVEQCCNFLKGPLFLNWLSQLLGSRLCVTRRPSPFRMKLGDCIVAHDDCSDYTSNRFSAVLHFSKAWKREFGGNIIIGEVKRIEMSESPQDASGRRWIFSEKRSVVVPAFNSLVLIALKPGLAHKVTRVRVDDVRLTIVATYGLDTTTES
jgi:hypothetical protein